MGIQPNLVCGFTSMKYKSSLWLVLVRMIFEEVMPLLWTYCTGENGFRAISSVVVKGIQPNLICGFTSMEWTPSSSLVPV